MDPDEMASALDAVNELLTHASAVNVCVCVCVCVCICILGVVDLIMKCLSVLFTARPTVFTNYTTNQITPLHLAYVPLNNKQTNKHT